jgi:hypothetical protein
MGLLRLPRMPELKKGSPANALDAFVASPVEPDSIKFKDKTREKQRQQVRVCVWGGGYVERDWILGVGFGGGSGSQICSKSHMNMHQSSGSRGVCVCVCVCVVAVEDLCMW